MAVTVAARLRIAARLLGMLAALLGSVGLYYLYRLLGRPNPWPRRFLGSFGRIAGAQVQTRGKPIAQGVLLANHVSWLDIPALARASGTSFVAHDGLAGNSLARRLCEMNGTVFVARTERASVAAQVGEVRQALARTGLLTIFPEGGTSDGTGVLPFKSALLSALDPPPPGAHVQPVWIDYGPTPAEIAWVGDEPGMTNLLRVLGRSQPIDVVVHFLEPLDPARAGCRKTIAAEARSRIESAMTGNCRAAA